MNTTDLFKFQFVNRNREQDILNLFFSDKSENTLWIKGESGMGKTTFFNYVFKNWNEYNLCYLNINNTSNSASIMESFIIELQKYCDIDFLSIFKKNYKKFYNSIYKNTKDITSDLFPTIKTFISIILDVNYHIINCYDERKNSIDVIIDYIKLILTNKKLCICIDNFSRCDIETAKLFFQIFKTFAMEEKFRSCIITTTEDLNIDLKEEIQRNLPFRSVNIDKFDKYIYFYQILNPIFELQNFTSEDLNYLYNKCQGSPKKLATVISKMLDKDAIFLSNKSKAKIKKEVLFSILNCEHIRFSEKDFTSIQKWIIFSYLCLSESANVEQVKDLALYISKKNLLYKGYNEDNFYNELRNLISEKVFCYDDNNNMLTTCHDLDYRELNDIFFNSPYKGIFTKYAYEFLKSSPYYSEKQELLCRNMRQANIIGWERINFCYGKILSKNKQFYDAQKIFMYLNDCFHKLYIMQQLFLALNSYETGNYKLAIEQLELIDVTQLQFKKAKYLYYLFLGKSYNNIGDVVKAIDSLEKSLNETKENSKEYVQILNILHMYYYEIPEKRSLSFEFFNKIRVNYKSSFPQIWANTMRGCQNFLKNEEALEILKEADSILEDDIEKAFIKTTRGFILVKQDNIEEAKKEFENACKIIKNFKIHEYSYAANDLAICYMLNREYQKAKDILIEALFWNRTNYGKIVIQTHLMICALYLHQETELKEYYGSLELYMESKMPRDPIINRKVYLNLAIVSTYCKEDIKKQFFYEKAGHFIKNTVSEWRYYKLKKEMCPNIIRPASKYETIEDFEPWFLIYAHD